MITLETKKLFNFLQENYVEVPKNCTGFVIYAELDNLLRIDWHTFAKAKDDSNASS